MQLVLLERILNPTKPCLEQAGQDVPENHPVLELNPAHPLVARLTDESESERFDDLALVLFEQALLSEGATLQDPAGFVRRVNTLLTGN